MQIKYNAATTITTASVIDITFGTLSLMRSFTIGYTIIASIAATVNGSITAAVSFKTAPKAMQEIKIIKKNDALPEWNVLNTFFTILL
jgi:hypothetical protein